MPTQNQTKTNFDPTSLGQYQSFWSMASPMINSLISNPLSSPFFQQNLGQNMQASSQANSNMFKNALSNLTTSGLGGPASGITGGLMSQLGRAASGNTYQAYSGAVNSAQQGMWNALGVGASRSPLVTGQTQQTSGLGTWLPQAISAGLGAATGGLSSALGGSMSPAFSAMSNGSGGSMFSQAAGSPFNGAASNLATQLSSTFNGNIQPTMPGLGQLGT